MATQFVLSSDVILRMGLDGTLSGAAPAVDAAILAAQLHVEAVMGARLDISAIDCRFYCDPEAFSGLQTGGMYRLELPNNFIRQDSSLTISVANKLTMQDAAPPDDYTTYLIDYKRGYVLMDADTYGKKYIRVQCTAGFQPTGESIPDDLYEAILAMVPVIFDITPTTKRDPQAEANYRKATFHSFMLLKPYLRLDGFSFRPLYSAQP